MELTDCEKAASFLGFVKCPCDCIYPTTFFKHPEKGWCCRCCDGKPVPERGWIQNHYKGHHNAPDMQDVTNWFKALCQAYIEAPAVLERAEGAFTMEVMGMKGAMETFLAREYDWKTAAEEAKRILPPVESKPSDPQPVPPAKKVRVRVVGSRRLKRAKSKDQDLPASSAG